MGISFSFSNLSERYNAANEYVDAIHDLPPTYKTFENLKNIPQIIPDPVTPQMMKRKLERVKNAEFRLKESGNNKIFN